MAFKPTRRMGISDDPRIVEKKVQLKSPNTVIVQRAAFGEIGNHLTNLNKPKNGAIPKISAPKQSATELHKHTLKRTESRFTKDCILKLNPEPGYSVNLPIGVIDVDNTESDPMLVAEYIKDIMTHLLDLETKYQIKENFLEAHNSSPKIRAVLINWLSEVCANFKFVPETFHLSVAIVDRFLQANTNIGRETLQLVGTVALLIAGKYEELFIPDLQDYIYICDDEFTRKQMLRMEVEILNTLEFSFGRPLSLHFLRRYNKVAMVNALHHSLGKYILELALQEYELCHIKPSIQAAAACFLSISILNEIMNPYSVWTKNLRHYSTYSYTDIKKTVIEMTGALVKAETAKHQAIRKKYASSVFAKISTNPLLKGAVVLKLSKQSKILKK